MSGKLVFITKYSIEILPILILFAARGFRSREELAASREAGEGQSVILRSGTETALVDCGSGNNWRDAGCDTADELLTMGCRRVDRVRPRRISAVP